MSDKPAAEVSIDVWLVRKLLIQQAGSHGDAASAPLRKVAEGWDCEIWRWGDDLAVRLPRRALSAPLIAHEAAALRVIGPLMSETGVHVPVPLLVGAPQAHYPWPWSVVPWIGGTAGLSVPRARRRGWAAPLASALRALHTEAPADAPPNPVRGVPLAARDAAVRESWATLERAEAHLHRELLNDALELWTAAVAAPVWSRPPVWIHGDLHLGNLIAHDARLVGIIDFGDVTAGDPAYDLAVAWLAFDRNGREEFLAALEGCYDDASWVRARGWAVAMALLLSAHSDDAPGYRAAGHEAMREVVGDVRFNSR